MVRKPLFIVSFLFAVGAAFYPQLLWATAVFMLSHCFLAWNELVNTKPPIIETETSKLEQEYQHEMLKIRLNEAKIQAARMQSRKDAESALGGIGERKVVF